jgi:glycosyltransferase involved in cell wall biosynthesis
VWLPARSRACGSAPVDRRARQLEQAEERVKILAIYRYYWPDTTPYARILRSILERLVDDGHQPVVFAGQPAYNDIKHAKQPRREMLGGVEVRRMSLLPERKWLAPLRTLNFFLFLTRACLHAFFNRYDIILASSNPPVISGMALRLISWMTATPYIYHCQDLHPECATLVGKLTNETLSRQLARIDSKNCQHAARAVVLSEDMRQAIRDRGLSGENVTIINNFILELPAQTAAELPVPFDDTSSSVFRILFAGNIGSFQGLDKIVKAARLLQSESSIQFVLMGAGEQIECLRQLADSMVDRTVHFLSYQPMQTAFGCMQCADLGIVSLIPGVYRVAFPSKTMMYLAAGCPVLAVIEPHSVLAAQLVREQLGWVPDATTPEAIAAAIQRAREDTMGGRVDRSRIRKRGFDLFDREVTLEKWATMFREMDTTPTSQGRDSYRAIPVEKAA